jgi:GDSL/SGNH-like Acyl-Esterase family found in Pmr5 and Cas1p
MHRWGPDKFPKEKPLVFFMKGKPINPPLGTRDGLNLVINSMVSYIEREVPERTLKLWRTQSPRHFSGGEWDHNGSCLFDEPLKEHEVTYTYNAIFYSILVHFHSYSCLTNLIAWMHLWKLFLLCIWA